MCRNAGAEAAPLRERRRGRAWCREAPRLVDAAQFLRVALRPTARQRRVVIDEDKGAVSYRRTVEGRLDQHEGFAILITRRISQFVIRSRVLPVEEPEKGATGGFVIQDEAGR